MSEGPSALPAPAQAAVAEQAAPPAARLVRRQRIFIGAACAATLVSVGALVASTWIKSPAQQLADQGAPGASLLTAPVGKQVLSKTVTVRGTVIAGGAISVQPTTAQGAATLVVTALPKKAGSQVAAGEVLAQVSGRPVIALPGPLPAYRDLKPGDRGPDVAQLQNALKQLGHADSDESGVFGPGTKEAITGLYQQLGYEPPTTGGPGGAKDAAQLAAAKKAVTLGRRAVDIDKAALAAAQNPAPPAGSSTAPPPADAATVAKAKQQLGFDSQDLAEAQDAYDRLVATTGVDFPMDELVFIPSFPATVAAVNGSVGGTLGAVGGSAPAGPLLTVDTGSLGVGAILPQGENELVKATMPVVIGNDTHGQSVPGTVGSIGPFTAPAAPAQGAAAAPGGQGQPGYPMTVTPSTPLPASWLGAGVTLTITTGSTSGPVLVVPAAAVTTGADRSVSVTVLAADRTQRRVPVTPGVDAAGLVEVTPVDGAVLNPGDNVVTGQ
ncbi:peptidoglycan-binding protein [Kitasatospora indigofera]|uniref:peptidoglycan-binding protein n=1 Tax=Kitasatospora indigofera TaxID=67307 RepID=UPI00369DBD0C